MQSLQQQKETMVYVAIQELNPAVYNPRKWSKKATDDLTASIKRFGLIDPIIVNKARGNTVVGGHFRLHVAKKLGYTEVPCVFVSIEDEQKEKELNLRLNKNSGDWDWSLLKDWETSLLREAGFDDAELKEMMDQILEPVHEDDFDPTSQLEAKESKVKLGEVWQLGTHRLMCGDSTKSEDVERLMDGKKAEMLFTSPPYSDMREYNGGKDLSVGNVVGFIPTFTPFCNYQVINLGLKREEHNIVEYWQEYIEKAKSSGYKFLSWNVWIKSGAGSVGNQSAFFPIAHEWIFVFGRAFKNINRTEDRNVAINKRQTRSMRQSDGSMKVTSVGEIQDLKEMESWHYVVAEMGAIRKEHPATFPPELPYKYICAMTCIHEIVVEPFAGSGSTLIACEQTKRICYTMELDPKYCDVVIARWEKLTGQTAIKL